VGEEHTIVNFLRLQKNCKAAPLDSSAEVVKHLSWDPTRISLNHTEALTIVSAFQQALSQLYSDITSHIHTHTHTG